MLSRRSPSGLPIVEYRKPTPGSREALEVEQLQRAGAELDAHLEAAARNGAALDQSLKALAEMTEVERAELRFALRCDPEVRAILYGRTA